MSEAHQMRRIIRLTRTKARAMFLRSILNPTDMQMEALLDRILEDYSVIVVNDSEPNDDDTPGLLDD